METKSQIRNEFKRKRRLLDQEQVDILSKTICSRLTKLPEFLNARNVLVYSSIQNEVDLSLLIDSARKMNKNIYLPKVIGEVIKFYKYEEDNHLQIGNYNILEPDSTEEYMGDSDSIILVPGIAFSIAGERIGFGKGYYDRFLSLYSGLYKIGIAYDWQIVNELKSEEQDINMDKIISEKREVKVDDKFRNDM